MIISYAWLREMVDIPVSPDELAQVLTFLGLEVEKVTSYTPSLENVVIGEIVECERIAGSDHLFITRTRVGGETLPMVCGAPNTRTGLKSPVMLPGAVTADGTVVKKAKLRGQESVGMIASERELGLTDEHIGIIEGDAEWEIGAPAVKYLDLADTLYDVEITPNRPDYLSHVGVARDVAAKFRLPWSWPEHALREVTEPASKHVKVDIEAPQACPRYAARLVRGLQIGPSPFATRLRLIRCGVRPISNIVDVTNLLMLEFGHPLHAFDLRFIEQSHIIVRYAREGESFVTLDGKEHQLSGHDLLIADPKKGIALAGVMGGLNSEIRDDTRDVLIECAYFDPVHVRRTARMHELATESSRRFERGTDPNGVPRVIDATAALMNRFGGGEVLSGRVDNYALRIEPQPIAFRPKRACYLVGLEIPSAEMEDTLSRLGCEVRTGGESWQVTAPSFRPDLEREIDLIEEVIRVHGYEDIPVATVSRVPLYGRDDDLYRLRSKVVDGMVALGFHETMSVSMYTPDERRDPPDMPPGATLKNPVTDDMLVMQGSLLPQLVRSAASNWKRGDRNLRLFEVARAFREGSPTDPRTWERQVVAAVMTGRSYAQGWAHPAKPFDFHDLKGTLEVLAGKLSLDNIEIICYDVESGEVLKGELRSSGDVIGHWGIWPPALMKPRDIDAPVGWFEMDIAEVASHRRLETKYVPLPRFPISWRDIAVVVEEGVTSGSLVETIRQCGGAFLHRVEPFDVFRGEKLGANRKSVAIHLEFAHPERSLESDEVDGWVQTVVDELRAVHNAILR